MSKVPPVLLAALLALGALASLPTAHAATGAAGTAEFVDLAHTAAGSSTLLKDSDGDTIHELVGTGAVGVVHLKDADLESFATTTVTVTSSTDSTGESITLYNDPASGAGDFYGTFGVEGTSVSGNGLVQVAADGQFFVKYIDANPAGPFNTPPGSLEWKSSADGAISMAGDLKGSTSATVTATDPDANKNANAADTFAGRAFSASDLAGIPLAFTETGVATGDFSAPLSLDPTGTVSGKLKVSDGDQITVLFSDVDAHGHTVDRKATSIWHKTSSGAISFTTKDFTAAVDRVGGVGDKIANLRVEDPDLVGASSVTVNVTSAVGATAIDSIGMRVTLAATGTGTGEFTGSFGFTEGNTGTGKLEVAPGATVTARYDDARSGNGGVAHPIDQVLWNRAATVSWIDGSGNDVSSAPMTSTPHLRVIAPGADLTANKDTVQVHVFSSGTAARDPLGILVTLTETAVHSAVFEDTGGAFTYASTQGGTGGQSEATGTPGSGKVLVRTNDVLTAAYTDDQASGGVVTDPMQVTGGTAAPANAKGTIALKVCTASCGSSNPTLAAPPAGGFFGIASNLVFVELVDNNFGDSDSTATPIPARVGSFTDPIRWKEDGTGLTGGIGITLMETGPATHHFVGHFGTTLGASNDFSDLIQVSGPTDTIGAAFAYENSPKNMEAQDADDSTPSDPTDNSYTCPNGDPPVTGSNPLHQDHCNAKDEVGRGVSFALGTLTVTKNAGIEFRDALRGGSQVDSFTGLGNGYIAVVNTDPAEDTKATADTLKVRVRSTSDPTGFDVTLTERYGHADGDLHLVPGDNAFVGQILFTTDASAASTGKLKVADGDVVEASYSDSHTSAGPAGSAASTATWRTGATGTLTLPASIRAGTPGVVQVNDADRNADTGSVDQVVVQVVPDRAREAAFPLTLTETSANSGVFKANLGVEIFPSCGANTAACVTSGDRVLVRYDDPSAATGDAVTVESTLVGLDSNGGLLVLDHASYATTSTTATVALDDPDLDVTGSADDIDVRVFADADGEGEKLTLHETGMDTHIFAGTFQFESGRTEGNGKVHVDNGDRVTVYYLDMNTDGTPSTLEKVPVLATATWTTSATSPPTATLVAAPTSGAAPLETTFTLTAADADGAIASYTLNFGDGTTPLSGTGVPPATTAHTYATNGTYTAKLTVTDNGGLTGNGTATVTVGSGSSGSGSQSNSNSNSNSGSNSQSGSGSSSGSGSGSNSGSQTGLPGAPTASQILAANQKVKVTVTHGDGKNTVKFELPTSGLPATVLGVQVWRSNSPYTLVATLPNTDQDFKDGSYDDVSANAKDTTKYLVTMYYGATSAFGLFTQSTAPDTAQYKGTSAADSSSGGGGGGLPSWAIVLIIVGILFLVVLVAVLIARGRNREAQGAAAQGYAWQETAETTEAKAAEGEWQPPAEVHQARCPSCGTSFTAAGTKPIVTVCPGCGKKGILR